MTEACLLLVISVPAFACVHPAIHGRSHPHTVIQAAYHMQAHGLGCHLDVPAITYSLALLRLPQLFMATYFVRGVETFSELSISLRRLNAFLALPEPPAPARLQGAMPGDRDSNFEVRKLPSACPLHGRCLRTPCRPCNGRKVCSTWDIGINARLLALILHDLVNMHLTL